MGELVQLPVVDSYEISSCIGFSHGLHTRSSKFPENLGESVGAEKGQAPKSQVSEPGTFQIGTHVLGTDRLDAILMTNIPHHHHLETRLGQSQRV